MVTSNPGCTIGGGGAVERAIVSWSTRNFVSTGDNITIEGFVVDGSDPKRILIKGLGPSLGDFGVPTPLSNPRIELYAGAVLVAANDDWGTTNPLCGAPVILCEGALAIQGTGQDPCAGGGTGCNQEAALLVTLPPGDYSVFLRGVSGGTGIGLVETVDLDLVPSSILNNAATRGLVQTADGIMIGSLNVGGANPATFLIRGRGPSLGSSPFNLSGVLADPDLSLLSGTTVIAQNNDWGTNDPTCGAPAIYCYSDTAINQLGFDPCTPNPGESLPPPNCAVESALLVTLPPGVYPIFLRGNLGGTGLGLIEVFHISTKVLANIATRSFFGTGDQVSIVGFYIEGIVPKEVVIRGRGISMAGPPFNISGTVSDPNFRIFDNASASYIAQNDNWGTPDPTSLCSTSGFTCGTPAEIIALGLDPCVPNP
ncbi:MAG: hypothetical protein GTN53_15465, partial [Candidatus Aminicenantes bacterium]|nr:hypothetical protein [Candidatus Aminicenantes bacterium]